MLNTPLHPAARSTAVEPGASAVLERATHGQNNKRSFKANQFPAMASPSDREAAAASLEKAKQATDQEFTRLYLQPSPQSWPSWTHPPSGQRFHLRLVSGAALEAGEVEACLELVRATSGEAYRASAGGWRPGAKRREMRMEGMRFVLVEGGRASWGLRLCCLPKRIPHVRKVMLTCFASNARGLAFYTRLGFTVDASSPAVRTLRGGRVVKADYVILSRGACG
ncbi:acyl-CoA N-acyltransferase [Ophiocordyceps camponoti-floridani]|uniref:Acyl-CoA N-acyltransferase n=1 Tax=Ophiocordyceps camponoti-floridani TaxID=2030778 RepID=A0A8H4QA46_9HYPO|nr:acyl-CoA N-acyltransferase [Ophiocordyceps camponoti-floridani]